MGNSCDTSSSSEEKRFNLKSWGFWKPIAGFFAGAFAGALYFIYIGSESVSSPVTNDIISNGLFGGMIGYFFVRKPCSACR